LKGVDLLAEAFRQVAGACPEARLILIGGGEEEQRVRYLLAKEIADGRAHLVPGVNTSDLAPWYRAMDVFILPSRYENYSNALLEAAACGIPFIASDIGGNRMLGRSSGGALFEPSSVADLVRQMREFFGDAVPRRARALAFSAAMPKQYSWDASADRLEWILESKLSIALPFVQGRKVDVRSDRLA
jgi:glycosyltransferase involved in cell wall biosynthesis